MIEEIEIKSFIGSDVYFGSWMLVLGGGDFWQRHMSEPRTGPRSMSWVQVHTVTSLP